MPMKLSLVSRHLMQDVLIARKRETERQEGRLSGLPKRASDSAARLDAVYG